MKIRITESQLKKCVNTVLSEGPFNDEGEPLMTHSQFRDYSEPSEPDYDDFESDYQPEMEGIEALKKYLKDQDILLETYDGEEYFIRSRDKNDYIVIPHGDEVDIYISGDKINEEFKNLDAVKAIRLLERYKENFLSIDEADRQANKEYEIDAQDRRNNAMERGMWEGEGDVGEQGLGDYPAGAANDSTAPWNQEDEPDPSLESIEVIDDDFNQLKDVYVLFTNDRGGEAEVTLQDILTELSWPENILNYFRENIKKYPRVPDWEQKIEFIGKIYNNKVGLDYMGGKEYEAPDEWDYADDYRDEMNENKILTKESILKIIKATI